MIATFILNLVANFYSLLFEWLPTGSLPTGVASGVNTVVSYMYGWNALFPIDTLFQVLTAYIVVESAILLFDLIQWILRKIPVLNIK